MNPYVFWGLALAAGLTAFYITRQLGLVFLGNPRSQASYYARESKNTMTTPLLVLAFFSIVVGWAGIPDGFPILSHLTPSWIERLFTSPVFTESVVLSGLESWTQCNQRIFFVGAYDHRRCSVSFGYDR